jgi:acyl dehydratase
LHPAAFTVVEPRTFEDLKVGDIFRAPSRTLTDAHATAFQAVSADNHPIHYNVEYARSHGHTAPVVHGLQVLAFTAPGAARATIHNQHGQLVLEGEHTYLLKTPPQTASKATS